MRASCRHAGWGRHASDLSPQQLHTIVLIRKIFASTIRSERRRNSNEIAAARAIQDASTNTRATYIDQVQRIRSALRRCNRHHLPSSVSCIDATLIDAPHRAHRRIVDRATKDARRANLPRRQIKFAFTDRCAISAHSARESCLAIIERTIPQTCLQLIMQQDVRKSLTSGAHRIALNRGNANTSQNPTTSLQRNRQTRRSSRRAR